MFAAFCRNPSPSVISIPSNRRITKVFRIRASASHLPLASRLFVRNLSYSTNESILRKEFSNFGQVVEVKLVKDESTKRSRGYAFVQYTSQDDAILAIENLDRKCLDGRVVLVELAKPMNFRFAAYPRTSGPPVEQTSRNQVVCIESSNEELL